MGLLHHNAARLIEPISVRREEVEPLSEDELGRLLFEAEGDRLGAYLKVAVALGLRPGEARALTWADVDVDGEHPALYVRQAFSRSPDGERLGPPKTPGSRRTIALPGTLLGRAQGAQAPTARGTAPGRECLGGRRIRLQQDGRPLSERRSLVRRTLLSCWCERSPAL